MRLAAYDFSVFEYHALTYTYTYNIRIIYYKATLPIYLWILIFSVYAYVHMDPSLIMLKASNPYTCLRMRVRIRKISKYMDK